MSGRPRHLGRPGQTVPMAAIPISTSVVAPTRTSSGPPGRYATRTGWRPSPRRPRGDGDEAELELPDAHETSLATGRVHRRSTGDHGTAGSSRPPGGGQHAPQPHRSHRGGERPDRGHGIWTARRIEDHGDAGDRLAALRPRSARGGLRGIWIHVPCPSTKRTKDPARQATDLLITRSTYRMLLMGPAR
jgi:hypothetical protein